MRRWEGRARSWRFSISAKRRSGFSAPGRTGTGVNSWTPQDRTVAGGREAPFRIARLGGRGLSVVGSCSPFAMFLARRRIA